MNLNFDNFDVNDPRMSISESRGVDPAMIAGWMKNTPTGKRYAGWTGGSKGNFPAYVDAPQFTGFVDAPAKSRSGTLPVFPGPGPTTNQNSAEAASMMNPVTRSESTLREAPAMMAAPRKSYRDQQAENARNANVRMYLGDNAAKLTFVDPARMAETQDQLVSRIMGQVGPKPGKGYPSDKWGKKGLEQADWEQRRAKAASSAVGQAWFWNKQGQKAESERMQQAKMAVDMQNAAEEMGLKQRKDVRETVQLQGEMEDRNWSPSSMMVKTGPGSQDVPVLMTSPRSAQQVKVDPLPTNLPTVGSKKGDLVFTGKVNGQGLPVWEQTRNDAPATKVSAYELEAKTTRKREILQELANVQKEMSAGNKKPGLDIWPGGENFTKKKTALENELAGIDAVLSGRNPGNEGGDDGNEKDPLGLLD